MNDPMWLYSALGVLALVILWRLFGDRAETDKDKAFREADKYLEQKEALIRQGYAELEESMRALGQEPPLPPLWAVVLRIVVTGGIVFGALYWYHFLRR